MRVVAGKFKGRRLAGPKGGVTRPTSDKVREALFSIVGPVDGLRVLDLFAGTGALGIEALSRGSAHVTFVERDNRMRAVLRTNLNVVAADAEDGFAVVHGGEALDYLRRAAGAEQFDLVLIDPPYNEAERLAEPLAEALPAVLASGAIVVAECDRRTPLLIESALQDGRRSGLTLTGERRYGDTLLRILKAPIAG
jgi:16S rRNA (guanine966-N2)-methyltransferase